MAAHTSSSSCVSVFGAYRLAVWRTFVFWLIATPLLTLIMRATDGSTTADVLAVALGSIVVAVVSLAPALTLRQDAALASRQTSDYSASHSKTRDEKRTIADSSLAGRRSGIVPPKFLAVMVAGIVIRLVGTVALFLTCRYQLASTPQMIAVMTIGWYVSLTSVGISTVASRISWATPVGCSND